MTTQGIELGYVLMLDDVFSTRLGIITEFSQFISRQRGWRGVYYNNFFESKILKDSKVTLNKIYTYTTKSWNYATTSKYALIDFSMERNVIIWIFSIFESVVYTYSMKGWINSTRVRIKPCSSYLIYSLYN